MTFLFLFLDLIKTWEFTHIILLSLLKFLKLLAAGRVTQWSAGLNPNILEIVYRSLQCLQNHVLQYLYFNVFFCLCRVARALTLRLDFWLAPMTVRPGRSWPPLHPTSWHPRHPTSCSRPQGARTGRL